MPPGFVAVAAEADVPEGGMILVHASGHPILLCRVHARVYACSSECTYDDTDMGEGTLDGYHLTCPTHGCVYDVRSGRITNPPAEEQLPTYECRIEGDQVWVAHRPRGF